MTPPLWQRYVAIGDSFTEGMCDPDPGDADAFRGWADRLAGHLSAVAADQARDFGYANLAVRGRKLADVVGPQLDSALAMSPDLVSIVGGGNDLLRPRVAIDTIAEQLDEAVCRLRAAGAEVLLATPGDTAHAGLFRALRPRHAIHTANLQAIAARHGAHLIDLWGLTALQDWRMWAPDRIHLTSEGHRRVALAAVTALGFPTDRAAWASKLPPADPAGRRAELAGHAAWGREYFGPWVQRRLRGQSSGDTVMAKRPGLSPIAPERLS